MTEMAEVEAAVAPNSIVLHVSMVR
jgi:hypothetical protein